MFDGFLICFGILVQQGLGRHDHARRAEPALDPAVVHKGLLDGMQAARMHGQALDGLHLFPLDIGCQKQA
jgi:hypothetical protein